MSALARNRDILGEPWLSLLQGIPVGGVLYIKCLYWILGIFIFLSYFFFFLFFVCVFFLSGIHVVEGFKNWRT